jgi:hypothetical protein
MARRARMSHVNALGAWGTQNDFIRNPQEKFSAQAFTKNSLSLEL